MSWESMGEVTGLEPATFAKYSAYCYKHSRITPIKYGYIVHGKSASGTKTGGKVGGDFAPPITHFHPSIIALTSAVLAMRSLWMASHAAIMPSA